MGLYGSGDSNAAGTNSIYGGSGDGSETLFKFGEETQSAFKELQSKVGHIIKLFTMEKTLDEEIEDQRREAKKKEQERNASLLLEEYKDLPKDARDIVDTLAIFLWWKDEISETNEELAQLSPCLFKETKPEPNIDDMPPTQEAVRLYNEKKMANIKAKDVENAYKNNTLKELPKLMHDYRGKFIDAKRVINKDRNSKNVPYFENQDEVNKRFGKYDVLSFPVRIGTYDTTPKKAWTEIPDDPEGNQQKTWDLYTGRAVGEFLAEDRKESTEKQKQGTDVLSKDTDDANKDNSEFRSCVHRFATLRNRV